MKNILLWLSISMLSGSGKKYERTDYVGISGKTENLLVVTIDGVRWNEVFGGADSSLINNEEYTENSDIQKMLYWDDDPAERRKKLMPFFWSVLAKKGQVLGNRIYDNNVDVANPYRISYAGYNELFTGNPDWFIFNNNKRLNGNKNIFEKLNGMNAYRNQIALFSSWSVLPYVLRRDRNDFFMNSAYEPIPDTVLGDVNAVQQYAVFEKGDTRRDWLTYISAREYIQKKQPKIVYLALGETDEYAHKKRYDLYLHHLNAFDRMLSEIWCMMQAMPAYKNNTTLLITTDHGRGGKTANWNVHGWTTAGSSHTWLGVMGPHVNAEGERKDAHQLYAKDFPQIIYHVLGVDETPQSTEQQNKDYAGKSK